jgi:hypothetical protein
MIRTLALSALFALVVSPAFAQDTPPAPQPEPETTETGGLKVGDDAPDFSPRNWINPPTWESFAELRGDVILLKAWGIN